jgi:hypothetical protein
VLRHTSTYAPLYIDGDQQHFLNSARRHFQADRLFLAARALFPLLECVGREDLITSGVLDTATVARVLGYFRPGPCVRLPTRDSLPELKHELSRLSEFIRSGSKTAMQKRWHIGRLERATNGGWSLHHSNLDFWRGFAITVDGAAVAAAKYEELSIALANAGVEPVDDEYTLIVLPHYDFDLDHNVRTEPPVLQAAARFIDRLARSASIFDSDLRNNVSGPPASVLS